MDVHEEAELAYRDAVERLRFVKAEWERRDCPLTTAGSMGQERPHPLWTMLQDAEVTAARLRNDLKKRHRGPEPKAVLGASLGPSPAQLIRRVK